MSRLHVAAKFLTILYVLFKKKSRVIVEIPMNSLRYLWTEGFAFFGKKFTYFHDRFYVYLYWRSRQRNATRNIIDYHDMTAPTAPTASTSSIITM